MSVLSACHVYRGVLLFSFTRCRGHSVCQCLLLGHFFRVRLCSSTCIWGIVLMLYQGFVLVFYIESSSSYYIEALSSYLWGFVLIFYFEASFSYFIWSLFPHICYRGFVLIFDLRFHPHGYILRWCSSVWDFGPHCCRPLLVCFQWFVCGSVCLYFCLGLGANIIWFEFSFKFFTSFYVYF